MTHRDGCCRYEWTVTETKATTSKPITTPWAITAAGNEKKTDKNTDKRFAVTSLITL